METKALSVSDFDLKDDGSVLVAFARFNEIDHDKDVTYPGSVPVKTVPMSDFNHSSWPQRGGRPPVGVGDLKEDGPLAIFDGRFFLKTRHGADAYETVKGLGPHQQWSYGFDVKEYDPKPKQFPGARRGLKSLDIHEVSPVLLGAGRSTGTLAIKGLEDDDWDLLVGSFSEQADRVLVAAKELGVRESEIIDLRVKEGRAISSARRARLEEYLATMRSLVESTENLLAETEPKPKDEPVAPAVDGKARLAAAQAELRAELIGRGYGLDLIHQ